MRTALRKMGNSKGVIVPKALLMEIGAAEGEPLEINVEDGRLVLTRVDQSQEADTMSGDQQREIAALSAELDAAADRMAERLDQSIDAVRSALDPVREAAARKRHKAEFAGSGAALFAGRG